MTAAWTSREKNQRTRNNSKLYTSYWERKTVNNAEALGRSSEADIQMINRVDQDKNHLDKAGHSQISQARCLTLLFIHLFIRLMPCISIRVYKGIHNIHHTQQISHVKII